MRNAFVRARASLALLLERRGGFFLTVDALFMFVGLSMAMMQNGRASDFYIPMFLAPALLLAVPMLSETVAVERRSGTLDLALSSPGARFYFERRVAAVIVLLVAQGWLGLVIARAATEPFPFAPAMLQIVVTSLFIGAVTLNWSLRLETAGAVVFATFVTVALFAPWFFANPIHPPAALGRPMSLDDLVQFTKDNLVLAGAAAVFYLYSLQRLMKPETIIT